MGIIVTLPVSGILAERLGWEMVFYVTGGFGVAWSVFWFLLVVDTPAQHSRISEVKCHSFPTNVSCTFDTKFAQLFSGRASLHRGQHLQNIPEHQKSPALQRDVQVYPVLGCADFPGRILLGILHHDDWDTPIPQQRPALSSVRGRFDPGNYNDYFKWIIIFFILFLRTESCLPCPTSACSCAPSCSLGLPAFSSPRKSFRPWSPGKCSTLSVCSGRRPPWSGSPL